MTGISLSPKATCNFVFLLKCGAQNQSNFSQNGLIMHWSDKLLLCSTDYISVNASLFYLFLPTHITIDDTQVQGCYQLKLIPSQLFFTPSFFHPFLPPFFHPSFLSSPVLEQCPSAVSFFKCVLSIWSCYSYSGHWGFISEYVLGPAHRRLPICQWRGQRGNS